MWTRLRSTLPILVVLIIAAALRFWGLRWGLPDAMHSYSYHPDEFLTVGAAGMIVTSFFPRFYNYPSLYLYLVAFALLAASAYGLATDTASAYLSARVVTALLGTAAVVATYWAGLRLWRTGTEHNCPGPNAGSPGNTAPGALLAALILCIAPLHVQHSHFATVDVPSTLFVALCLGFAGSVLCRGSLTDYALCGAMAGLAAGTKYNAGLVVLSLIAAHFLGRAQTAPRLRAPGGRARHREEPQVRPHQFRRLLAGIMAFIAAFALSTPAIIFRTSDVLGGIAYEVKHASEGHGLVFAGTGSGFAFAFTSSLWYGLGPPLAILFLASAINGLARKDKRALMILAFAIPYYALISLSQVRFARYALPLFPPAALLISWTLVDLWPRLPRVLRWAGAGAMTAALAGTLLYTVALDRLFVQQPPQDRAARWIFANIPEGSRIGVVEVPWFYSPPYSRTIGFGSLPQRERATESAPYNIEAFHSLRFVETRPRWVVISDFEIADAERINGDRGDFLAHARQWARRDYARLSRLREIVEVGYKQRAEFSDLLRALGISFGSTQSLPHDMRYPAPTIWIYERKQ